MKKSSFYRTGLCAIALVCILSSCAQVKTNPTAAPSAASTVAVAETEALDANVVSAVSFDGNYRAETFGIDYENPISGIYPAEEIRIADNKTNKILWSMAPGYLKTDFQWSPDSRYLAVSYMARIYQDAVIVDTKDFSTIELPAVTELQSEIKPNETRPDPYYEITGWENNHIVNISLSFTGEDLEDHRGEFTFDAARKQVVSYRPLS